MTFTPAEHRKRDFVCVHCGVHAQQRWVTVRAPSGAGGTTDFENLEACQCSHCNQNSFWWRGVLIYPNVVTGPVPHVDMPPSVRSTYEEARAIFEISPRAAAALLRLAVQELLVELNASSENLNRDIGQLVATGLPAEVQQALDYCRVIENNAVHPGEINLNDSPEICGHLFQLINIVVEEKISRPAQVSAMFESLPQGAREAVARRDSDDNSN